MTQIVCMKKFGLFCNFILSLNEFCKKATPFRETKQFWKNEREKWENYFLGLAWCRCYEMNYWQELEGSQSSFLKRKIILARLLSKRHHGKNMWTVFFCKLTGLNIFRGLNKICWTNIYVTCHWATFTKSKGSKLRTNACQTTAKVLFHYFFSAF